MYISNFNIIIVFLVRYCSLEEHYLRFRGNIAFVIIQFWCSSKVDSVSVSLQGGSPCGSLHAGDTDVSNPTRWLILTGSGYACAKVAVCPEQPSHFNSHPPQPPRANVVVVAKPTRTRALRAANVIIVRHVSHLMKNEKKILQRAASDASDLRHKRKYRSIPVSAKLNLVQLLRNTFVFSRLLFPSVCYLTLTSELRRNLFFINCCECLVANVLFLLSLNKFSFKLYETLSYLQIFISIFWPIIRDFHLSCEEYLRMREIQLKSVNFRLIEP